MTTTNQNHVFTTLRSDQTGIVSSNSWGWIMATGVLAAICGIVALMGPVMFGLGATVFFGATLLIVGAIQVVSAIRARKQIGFGISLFSGVMALIAGFVLMQNPLAGMVTMGAFIALYFGFSGISRMVMSFELKPAKGWGWILFGGAVSTILGVMLFAQLPVSGLWLVGTLIGVDMLFHGFGQIALSLQVRKYENRTA